MGSKKKSKARAVYVIISFLLSNMPSPPPGPSRGHRSSKSDTVGAGALSGAAKGDKRGAAHAQAASLELLAENSVLNSPQRAAQPPQSATVASFAHSGAQVAATPLVAPDLLPINAQMPAKRNTSPKLRQQSRLACPEGVTLLSANELARLVRDKRVLVVDTRPFHDYCKSHVLGAINLSLPSTLSRRTTFTLDKCIQTLNMEEKSILQRYVATPVENQPEVVILDNFPNKSSDISSAVNHLSLKFVHSQKSKSVAILEGGFHPFEYQHADLTIPGAHANLKTNSVSGGNGNSASNDDDITYDNDNIHPSANNNTNNNHIANTQSHSHTHTHTYLHNNKQYPVGVNGDRSVNGSENIDTTGSTIQDESFSPRDYAAHSSPLVELKHPHFPAKSPLALSRFTLPDVSHLPNFKARHNEELLSNAPDSSLHLKYQLTPKIKQALPSWLEGVYGDDMGASELSKKFNSLQIQERERLNNALTANNFTFNTTTISTTGVTAMTPLNSSAAPKKHVSNSSSSTSTSTSSTTTDGGLHNGKINTNKPIKNLSPKVSSGFELGRKNRYKDILPYEHSRVKIKPYEKDIDQDDEKSYINASYLHYPLSKLHYIATQGPLNETVGDFWKVIFDHRVPIIISLTPEVENYIEKCAPFWVPGNYNSNGIEIEVKLIDTFEDFSLSPYSGPDEASDNINVTLRHFEISVGGISEPPLNIIQIHVTTWPDHGVLINSESLIGLVSLKKYIHYNLIKSGKSEPQRSILVHCSAGSGRTGCFCCIDTAIDQILLSSKLNDLNNKNNIGDGSLDDIFSHPASPSNSLEEDPITPACQFVSARRDNDLIYNITSSFRTQRVAVVQNLRQYILIYDSLVKFYDVWSKCKEKGEDSDGCVKCQQDLVFTKDGLVNWDFKIQNNTKEGLFVKKFLDTCLG